MVLKNLKGMFSFDLWEGNPSLSFMGEKPLINGDPKFVWF